MNYNLILLLLLIILIIQSNHKDIRIWILNRIILKRGILAPNCFWYKISDLLNVGSGVELYNDLKISEGDFPLSYQYDEPVYIVTNVNYIKIILDNSPDTFGPGKLKQQFFSSFMSKNVGISYGCPWKKRRHMNDIALHTDNLHKYHNVYNTTRKRVDTVY